ncbi:MAG TPA: phenylalanine--tRNA ligase subunit alpha [Polyangia bacterium]
MASLADQLAAVKTAYLFALGQESTEQGVRNVYARFGGSNGQLRLKQKELLKLAPPTEKREIGLLTNELLRDVDAAFEAALKKIADAAAARDLERSVDVTLPGRAHRLGHLHPITIARREIEAIFAQIGFTVAVGPQVETDFHNFEALAMPKDHPARDMQDTFYVDGSPDVVLRTHTSPVQIRTMLARKPPVRVIVPGTVYRRDDDATHSPMFNQVEGLCVDEGVTFADLKGVLLHFARRYFGEEIGVRLRPSFFPFTEPSAEIDFTHGTCGGKGCRTCKGTGWIEIGGAGMVDPEVFRHVGYDSEKYTGFAFGWGIDRMAMLKYGVDNINAFFEGDVRFARQFR